MRPWGNRYTMSMRPPATVGTWPDPGGITTQREIDDLDALGIDAVVGMAIYTGALNPEPRTLEP